MNDIPKVSIIVPVYNVERYIEKCARSLFEQTCTDAEFIFVNDCTPDKSVEVLENVINQYPLLKEKIRIIQHEKNSGVAVARNTGLENAKGEYVLQVDSDDWVEETMIEELMLVAKESNADIIWTDFYIDYPTANRASLYRKQETQPTSEACINAILAGTMHGGSWNKLIKRELVVSNSIGFPAGVNMCEDLVFVIHCMIKTKKIHYYPKAFYHYVQNENSITIATNRKTFEYQFAVIKILEQKLPSFQFDYTLNLYKARLKSAVFTSGLFSNIEFQHIFPESEKYMISNTSGRINKIAVWFAQKNYFYVARFIIYLSHLKSILK